MLEVTFNTQKILLLFFGALCCFALVLPPTRPIIDYDILLEILIILLSQLYFKRTSIKNVVIIMFMAFYLALTFIIFMHSNNFHIADYLIAYKFIFYLIFMLQVSSSDIISERNLRNIFYIFLVSMFLRYVVVYTFELYKRPLLFTENNFELMIILLLWVQVSLHKKYVCNIVTILVLLTVLLSGSRSAMLSYIVIFISKRVIFNDVSVSRKIVISFFAIILLLSAISIFLLIRPLGDLSAIDRLMFVQVFLAESKGWSVTSWLFGTWPITPLSKFGCDQMLFYDRLFSRFDPELCYSPVFHSMLLRIIYDHGIIGLFFAYGLVYYALYRSGVKKQSAYMIIVTLLINGLSVSSINSPYVVLPLLLIIASDQRCFRLKEGS